MSEQVCFFERFNEIEAGRFGFFNKFFVDVKNKIVFVPQVYLHPRARICTSFVICSVFRLETNFLNFKLPTFLILDKNSKFYILNLLPRISAQACIFSLSTLSNKVLPNTFMRPPNASVATVLTLGYFARTSLTYFSQDSS
jgi:hypothetical protein